MTTRSTPDGTGGPSTTIMVNRAPVFTLWAAVVAERLGYDRDAALTLGRAVAGLNAQAKGRRLGIFEPAPPGEKKPEHRAAGETIEVELLGRIVPAVRTKEGLRAFDEGRAGLRPLRALPPQRPAGPARLGREGRARPREAQGAGGEGPRVA